MNKSMQDTLRVQLSELNHRGRQYGGQFWQVPFAYVGLTAVTFVAVTSRAATKAAPTTGDSLSLSVNAFLFLGIIGVCVLLHMLAMLHGNWRAVQRIREVEVQLGLVETAEFHFWYEVPLSLIAVLTCIVCFSLS